MPLFGACLGVQLLAVSLGAEVRPGPKPEVGILPVFLTDEAANDPVFAELPSELLTLQWHGDTFDAAGRRGPARELACVSKPGVPLG